MTKVRLARGRWRQGLVLSAVLRSALGVGVIVAFLFHSLYRIDLPFLRQLERNAYDLHLNASMPNTVDKRIVIADIDDKSLAELGQWPWRRSVIADLLDTLFEHYQVKAVGFDMAFPEPDRSDAARILDTMAEGQIGQSAEFKKAYQALQPSLQYDDQLAAALANRNVVLGIYFDQQEPLQRNWLSGDLGELDDTMRGKLPVPRPAGYTANVPILQLSAKASGYFDNPTTDQDGIFRRVAPVQEYDGKLYPSLAFALASLALDDAPISISPLLNESSGFFELKAIYLGDYKIPLDKENAADFDLAKSTLLVPFRGPRNSFPYLSIADILARTTKVTELQNRTVLIGTSAAGLLDLRSTPMQNAYPGVEVHANIISGIFDQRLMQQPTWMTGLNVALLLIVGLTMVVMIGRLSAVFSLLFTFSLIGAVLLLRAWFWRSGLFMPVVPLVLMILVLFMLDILYSYFVEARSKRSITKLFGQYVPKELVDEMALQPEDISMQSQSKELTVLFSDVRGFTTLSEKVPAQELSELMNVLLTPLTQVIHQHRGTIDKYMGDAVMAFWGAPLAQADHAVRAVKAALAMQAAVITINADFVVRGWPSIAIGVGLNTGPMAVGNMGSAFRMAYTVLGDAVNLGARLEGLTKQYGVGVIVGEATQMAAPEFLYRELDRVRVKGKEQPVTIYEPLGLPAELPAATRALVEHFHDALSEYRAQNWLLALKKMDECLNAQPAHPLFELYRERILFFRDNPPDEDWDGVFTHTSK